MLDVAAAKRGRITGGAVSQEVLDSSGTVLARAFRGARVGLQQYFSPPQASRLAAEVFGRVSPVLDPTAGNGALLSAFEHRFGIEIDPDHVRAGAYTAIQGDLQRVYPLLRLLGVRFPAVLLNPPFGLSWSDGQGVKTNSTVQCLRYALGLLAEHGQGMMIAGRDRFFRQVAPEIPGLYCVIECELFDDVQLPTVLAFFMNTQLKSGTAPLRLTCTREQLPGCGEQVRRARENLGVLIRRFGDHGFLTRAFADAAREHRSRIAIEQGGTPRYDLSVRGGRLACHLSAFATLALADRGLDRAVRSLDGKSIHYFALAPREWRQVLQAAEQKAIRIEPSVAGQVARVLAGAARDATPLYPLRAQQRLGFLEDVEAIMCVKSDLARGFQEGEQYPLSTATKVSQKEGERIIRLRSGEHEKRRTVRERRLLEVRVGREVFDESRESIEYLLEHFDVPDPGDIARRFPVEHERALSVIRSIEQKYLFARGRAFKEFQVDDLARLLVKGSGPLAWDTGLGKTLGQLTWAIACVRYWHCQDACLFVMPQDLIGQFQAEAQAFYGRCAVVISSQAHAKQVDRHVRRGGSGWYATYYEALSIVGRRQQRLADRQIIPPGKRRFEPVRLDADGNPIPSHRLSSAEFCPECLTDTQNGWDGTVCRACNYTHYALRVRPIASILAGTFRRGIICVDELTEMQGDDSLRGKAVRGLRCAHPLGGTATMISNYVNSCFHGLWWTCGNASARFPYDLSGKSKFENDFCVIEHVYGSDKKDEGHVRKRRRILPEVSNLSSLWRLLSMNMVRRRKEEFCVPRRFQPVRVPAGVAQLEHHRHVLKDFVKWFEQTHPDSPLVAESVVEQFAAGCGMLAKLDYAATLPQADPDHAWWGAPSTNWTPAMLKTLELALTHVRAGEKVLIGSSLIETGPWIAARLTERGVQALHITEQRAGKPQTKSPRKRAAELQAFRDGSAQVICAGVQAVKFGHNLPEVSTVILHGLPWTYLQVKQFVDRAWRLTSRRPVTVYVIVVPGLLSERKHTLITEKGAASDLALDGQLIETAEPEIDWNMELAQMRKASVKATGEEVPEQEVHALWQRAEGSLAAITPREQDDHAARAEAKLIPLHPSRADSEQWQTDVQPGEQACLFAA